MRTVSIYNRGLQKIIINLSNDEIINLMPKKSFRLMDSQITAQIRNLEKRGILKIKRI